MIIDRNRMNILVVLAALVITSTAVAQIYTCDGPDGPIYSDRKCGPDAVSVEVRDSSGLSGISDEDKSVLAARKLEREQAQGQNQKNRVINNQGNSYTTESPGRWASGRHRLRDRDNSSIILPVQKPATPRKRR